MPDSTYHSLITFRYCPLRGKVDKEGFQPKNLFTKEITQVVQDVSKSVLDFTTEMITSSMRDPKGKDVFKRSQATTKT